MTVMSNGQARKSLAQQLDRLDATLDGLSEGLSDTVVEAVKEAVGVAVQEAVSTVLRELLARPELFASSPAANPWTEMAPHSVSTPVKKLGLGERIRRARGWVGSQLRSAIHACGSGLCRIVRNCKARVQAVCCSAKLHVQQIHESVVDRVRRGYRFLKVCCQFAWLSRRLGLPLVVALVAGGAAAVAAWQCSPWVASMVSGIGGFAVALTVQVAMWLRRTMRDWPHLADCD